MRLLIGEDEFTCRRLLQKCLAVQGECDIAVHAISNAFYLGFGIAGHGVCLAWPWARYHAYVR